MTKRPNTRRTSQKKSVARPAGGVATMPRPNVASNRQVVEIDPTILAKVREILQRRGFSQYQEE